MNLYIGNLSYNVKESDLRHVMEEYGTVASVKLITDRETRRSKGFAFIEMPDDAEAAKAIEQLNGAEYVGRSKKHCQRINTEYIYSNRERRTR